MGILIVVFGLMSGCLLSVLVGMLGSRRRIGFGWAFVLSLLLSPLVGLLITLLSDRLPAHENDRWGCVGALLALLGVLFLVVFLLLLLTGGAMFAALL